jgi:hypothetical protein
MRNIVLQYYQGRVDVQDHKIIRLLNVCPHSVNAVLGLCFFYSVPHSWDAINWFSGKLVPS